MKPILLFILLFTFKQFGHTQEDFSMGDDGVYAIINDNDGFTNVRKSPDTKGAILGKIYTDQIFTCEVNKTNWWKVEQVVHTNKIQTSFLDGYVYKTHILLLSKLIAGDLRPFVKNNYTLKKNGITINITSSPFHAKNHNLYYSKADPNQNIESELTKIDGKYFWGTDGEIPKIAISSVNISIDNNSIFIPKTAYNDLYEPHLSTLACIQGPKNTFYIRMDNSDGAGAYTIIWIFKDDKYFGRYIDDSNV